MPNQLARQEGNVQSVVTEARDIISRNPRPSRPPGPLLHGPSLETPNEHHQAPRVTLDIYARSSHGGRPHQERKAPATISTSSSDSEDLAVDQARGLKRRRLALRPKRHNVQTTPSAYSTSLLQSPKSQSSPGKSQTKALYSILGSC